MAIHIAHNVYGDVMSHPPHVRDPKAVPKMWRAGRTDVSNLAVSVNELTPVSEPLYAVA